MSLLSKIKMGAAILLLILSLTSLFTAVNISTDVASRKTDFALCEAISIICFSIIVFIWGVIPLFIKLIKRK